jgi:hypothetical protein
MVKGCLGPEVDKPIEWAITNCEEAGWEKVHFDVVVFLSTTIVSDPGINTSPTRDPVIK